MTWPGKEKERGEKNSSVKKQKDQQLLPRLSLSLQSSVFFTGEA
jgi:hypothetical protein